MKTATGDDGARRLSLSDGEQLVDGELPSNGDSAPDSAREHLAGCTDPHGETADHSSSQNYFYIWADVSWPCARPL